jgi:hypothetical protein
MVLEETDLVVLPHEYGYCVYRSGAARCGGAWARVGLSTCIACSYFAVALAHAPFGSVEGTMAGSCSLSLNWCQDAKPPRLPVAA